jgi:hypothetical protein
VVLAFESKNFWFKSRISRYYINVYFFPKIIKISFHLNFNFKVILYWNANATGLFFLVLFWWFTSFGILLVLVRFWKSVAYKIRPFGLSSSRSIKNRMFIRLTSSKIISCPICSKWISTKQLKNNLWRHNLILTIMMKSMGTTLENEIVILALMLIIIIGNSVLKSKGLWHCTWKFRRISI